MTDTSDEGWLKPDETSNEAWRVRDLALVGLACVLYVAARLWRLDAACLWFDEIFGVHAAAWHEWGGMLRFVALDLIHPPLFYVLLKVWVGAFGAASVWWLRLLPVVAATLALVPFALLARELHLSARVLVLALVLAAASGTLIKYAQELRMYSLLLLFATCSLWLFARFYNATTDTRRAALWLCGANLLLVYTHYFGWLLVALELIFLSLFGRAKLKAFAATIVVLMLCFAPWAWAVSRAAREVAGGGLEQNLGWAARPRLLEIFEPYLLLHEPFRARAQSDEPLVLGISVVLACVIFAPPLVALCWRGFARRREVADEHDFARRALVFLAFFAFAPVVAAFALALVLPQSIWGVRHLLVVAPPYLLLAALALDSFRPRWLALAAKVLLGCWLALAAVVTLASNPAPPVWCAWETLARASAREDANARGEIKVYAFEDLVAYQLWYALRSGGERGVRVAVVRNVPGIVEDRAFFLPRGFAEVSVEDADAAMQEAEFRVAFRDAQWNEENPVIKMLRGRGYEIVRRDEFQAAGQRAFMVLARRR
ncbi:MAG: hypothetical protein ACJ741_13225 [Pyrinomonadaceae bacterium]